MPQTLLEWKVFFIVLKKLAEMFSSSTQTGGLRISIIRGEKEHAGHVERAKHQGLRNVMREDDDATLPMDDSTKPLPGSKPLPKPRDPVEIMLENTVGVGEHPNVIQEMNKLIGKVADANGKIEVLEKMVSQINEQIANENKA